MSQPFAGLRVIDFTQVLAGPFATQQLALLGADVIKIEQPGVGDQTRELMNNGWLQGSGASPAFLSLNVGKRSLTLDLKAPAARDIVLALVREADVVVENLRPGAMQRLGFDYPALAAVRPDLIYCSISGYGQTGPRAGTPAYDGAIQADSGMMSINGHADTGPTRTGYMPVDMATALNSAFAIAAALFRRQATGQGQYIDVAMMDTALVLQTAQVSNWLVHGDALGLVGNLSATGQPTASVFPTADGHVQIIALRDNQVRALLGALGVPELADTPDFATAAARIEAGGRVRIRVADLTRRETTAHWLQALAAAGVPVAPIRSLAEATADPQLQHRGVLQPLPWHSGAERQVPLIHAAFMTDADGPRAPRPPPRLGEHTDEILGALGYDAAAIAAFRASGIV